MAGLIEASGIGVALGGQRILEDVDFSASAGELVGLIGPNGAGKTTLLRVLTGLIEPDAGTVRIEGAPIGELTRRALAQRLAYLPQDHGVHWAIAVEDLVTLGRLPYRKFATPMGAADREATADAFRAMDLCGFKARPVTELSGGERARVLIARALAQDTAILLADEPAAGLDAAHQLELFALLRRLADDGRCVVLVLHDLSTASRFCDRLVVLDHGKVHAAGKADKVLTSKVLRSVYGISAYRGRAGGVPIVVPLKSLDAKPDGRPRGRNRS